MRPARPTDAGAVADIHIDAFRSAYSFPPAYSDGEVRAWVVRNLLPTTETWVADLDGEVVGYLSLGAASIEQLYVAPPHTGHGIGSRLLSLAKRLRPSGLELWTFQENAHARRFYERHGFRVMELTEGAGNDERQPDVRYAWSGTSAPGA